MMKIAFKRASCRVEFDYFLRGSVLKRTVESGCTAVRTHFEVESEAPADQVRDLIRNAKQGCFAENMITTAVPLTSTINLNGRPLHLAGITRD
jgi:uncharacterized OsmC-like protein